MADAVRAVGIKRSSIKAPKNTGRMLRAFTVGHRNISKLLIVAHGIRYVPGETAKTLGVQRSNCKVLVVTGECVFVFCYAAKISRKPHDSAAVPSIEQMARWGLFNVYGAFGERIEFE